jgi:hypothetical protein
MKMPYNAINVHWNEFYARKLDSLVTFKYGAILARVASMYTWSSSHEINPRPATYQYFTVF